MVCAVRRRSRKEANPEALTHLLVSLLKQQVHLEEERNRKLRDKLCSRAIELKTRTNALNDQLLEAGKLSIEAIVLRSQVAELSSLVS